MLTIQPFDPSSLKTIERALQESDLGVTNYTDFRQERLAV
jgi:ribosome recycling factor